MTVMPLNENTNRIPTVKASFQVKKPLLSLEANPINNPEIEISEKSPVDLLKNIAIMRPVSLSEIENKDPKIDVKPQEWGDGWGNTESWNSWSAVNWTEFWDNYGK